MKSSSSHIKLPSRGARSSTPIMAKMAAETLVATWRVASDMARGNGADFTAVLQPVADIGSPTVDYLNLSAPFDIARSEQYRAVYPLIREIAESNKLNFVDLTGVYDGCDECYIDFCHVGPQAHVLLVTALSRHLLN
jgi:hypothetical protein